jgi:SNF2 family DNA or RNA helicase
MCPACKDVFIYDSTTDELIEDLTSWINERLFYPAIESFSPLLGVPRKGGKSYEYDKGEDRQPTLFEFEENRECAHGLKEATCSFCLQREKSDKEKSTVIDAFDLIFPILQPPLGEDFDSPIAFPPGIELYPFQRGGIKFLVNNDEALLGDEMGLGKSIQAIVAVRFLFRMRKVPRVL